MAGALVDYSDSASASGESVDEEPPKKRLKGEKNKRKKQEVDGEGVGGADGAGKKVQGAVGDLPPLPSNFHDLYASTVRQSTSDDPSLHQGRKRGTPHVVGKWPSHVYVEWHPTSDQHDTLVKLLSEVEQELEDNVELHRFLTSDLGAPLPLHISLSRPLSLSTAEKDSFVLRLSHSLQTSGIAPFKVVPRGLAWYKSPDSDRTFLILRVTAHNAAANDMIAPNPELMALLKRCNTIATIFNEHPLYQQTHNEPVGSAFHVSVGWSFGLPSDEASLRSLKVLKTRRFAEVMTWEIDVEAVKVKIGNVVHHVPLQGKKMAGEGSVFER